MINANEVRIGNKVNFGLVPVTIRGIHTQHVYAEPRGEHIREHFYVSDFVKFSNYYAVKGYQLYGIPLTPEIFINKLGFEQHHDDCHNGVLYIKGIFKNPPFVWGVYPNELGSGVIIKDSKPLSFLHELQNLYWCLCGKELEIKF